MSYCRWSTDDFQCDLYCYQSGRGFETHVATRRRVYSQPLPPDVPWPKPPVGTPEDDAWWELFWARKRLVDDLEEGAGYELVPIGLPVDGESFCDVDLSDFYDRVKALKAMGYQMPDGLLESIREEGEEEARRIDAFLERTSSDGSV